MSDKTVILALLQNCLGFAPPATFEISVDEVAVGRMPLNLLLKRPNLEARNDAMVLTFLGG